MVGLRPHVHGSTKPGKDMEIQLINAFPSIALFVEKPLSLDSFEEVDKVSQALKVAGTVTSVGYMLRYVTGGSDQLRTSLIMTQPLGRCSQSGLTLVAQKITK